MKIMKTVWLALCAVFVVAVWLPFHQSDWWFVRMFDFPRVQILLGVLLLVGWGLFQYRSTRAGRVALVLLTASVVLLLVRILPYTPLYPKEMATATADDPDRRVRLYNVNVLQENRDYAATLRQIRAEDPDIVALLETDQAWVDAVVELRASHPYFREVPLSNAYGLAVYSRFPWRNPRVHELVDDSIPSLYATIELPGKDTFNLYVIHPTPPSPTENEKSTERDAELLLVADTVRQHDAPSIVMGDLNDVAWSHSSRLFKRTSGLLDPRIGRGAYNTFTTGNFLLRWPLDYIFPSDDFTLVRIERMPDVGSDHFPIIAELQYQPEMEAHQDEPTPEGDDMQDAAEQKAKVGM